jgi:YebC/PmpR family DNA-binding regulatory protein
MSGHNKWSKIKNKKAVTDAKKSKSFSKIVKFIQAESRKADGDINSPGLRLAISKAKEVNMPKENIERAIKSGSEKGSGVEEITYEAYGPGGCAIIIQALTDNRNKAAAEVKHILTKNGFSLAGIGSVTWAFEKKEGEWISKNKMSIPKEEEEKLESILEELEDNDEVQEVFTNVE